MKKITADIIKQKLEGRQKICRKRAIVATDWQNKTASLVELWFKPATRMFLITVNGRDYFDSFNETQIADKWNSL